MPQSHPSRRRQFLVDPQVQGALLWRVALYWFFFLISISLLQACWLVITRQASSSGELFSLLWKQCGAAMLASGLLLPILMLDCVRLTNRFAGPIVRMRRHLRQIAAGEAHEPIKLRDGDYWQSLADDYNAAFARLEEVEEKPVQPSAANETPLAAPGVEMASGATPVVSH